MKYKLLIIFILSVVTHLITFPLRAYPLGLEYSTVGGFIAYFFLTFYLFRKFGAKIADWKVLFLIILGQWILELPTRTIDFWPTYPTLPDMLFRSLGIICGYLSFRLPKLFRPAPLVLGCLIVGFMFFKGYDLWANKVFFGTFTGRVEAYELPVKFEAFDEGKNVITNEYLNGQVVLMDFWFTRCGACFEAFPQVQAAYDKFKNDPSVRLLSVDKPIADDKPGEAFEIIRKEGYTFPVVIAADEDLPENLGVTAYPTVLVIDREGKIVYRGDIAGAAAMVDELRSR
jgi:thiol-disulfide isomerase/thioredoxin